MWRSSRPGDCTNRCGDTSLGVWSATVAPVRVRTCQLGRSQVVRQRFLVSPCAGSNPAAPASPCSVVRFPPCAESPRVSGGYRSCSQSGDGKLRLVATRHRRRASGRSESRGPTRRGRRSYARPRSLCWLCHSSCQHFLRFRRDEVRRGAGAIGLCPLDGEASLAQPGQCRPGVLVADIAVLDLQCHHLACCDSGQVRQRTVFKHGELSPDKVACLEALGFGWGPHAARWEERFSELVRFKGEHGHCDVPRAWSKNPVLGNWVGTQRSNYRRGKLSPDRVELLEEIGFRF